MRRATAVRVAVPIAVSLACLLAALLPAWGIGTPPLPDDRDAVAIAVAFGLLRALLSQFAHFGSGHLALNLVALWLLWFAHGRLHAALALRGRGCAMLSFATALAGTLGLVALALVTDPAAPAPYAGLSSALHGVYAAILLGYTARRDLAGIAAFALWLISGRVLLAEAAAPLWSPWLDLPVATRVHAQGFIAGSALAIARLAWWMWQSRSAARI